MLYTTLQILDICRSIQHIRVRSGRWLAIIVKDHFLHWVMHLRQHGRTADSITEILTAKNSTAQVVTAIQVITDIRETIDIDTILQLTSNVGLSMSLDISITRTRKGVEYTSVTQVDVGITGNRTFEATTIDEFGLSHIGTVVLMTTTDTWIFLISLKVDISAIIRVVFINVSTVLVFVISNCCDIRLGVDCRSGLSLTNSPFLTATEYLEYIASI